MSVDIRSRVDGEVEAVDPARCFGEVLPEAFERQRDRLDDARPRVRARAVGARGRRRRVDARRRPRHRPRARRSCRRRRRPCCASRRPSSNDLVTDQVTVVGMQTNGSLDQPVGRFDELLDWWLLLRGALDAARAARARRDRPRRRVGRAPRARPPASPPTRRSTRWATSSSARGTCTSRACSPRTRWRRCRATWTPPHPPTRPATADRGGRATATASELLVRMQYFDDVSPAVERLVARRPPAAPRRTDRRRPRVRQHGRTTASRRCSSRSTWSRASPTCPWHKDCALGRHSYDCCSDDGGHLGDRRRRACRASCGRSPARTARSMWPSDHREDRSDLPAVDAPDPHRRRHRAPLVHAAQVAATGRTRAPGALHRLPAADCAAPTPSVRRANGCAPSARTPR